MSASDFEWSRSSTCANGACVEARRLGGVVLVQDSKVPASGGGIMQAWSLSEWRGLVAAVKAHAHHPAVDVLPTDEVWLGFQHAARHEILRFDLDEWDAFVSGVRRGEFDIDKLSGPVGAGGRRHGTRWAATGAGASAVATGAGGISPASPAPVAAEWVSGLNGAPIDVPAGRLTGAPASLPPQEAGQPGPDVFAPTVEEVEELAAVLFEAEDLALTGPWPDRYRMARYILAAGYARLEPPPAEVTEHWCQSVPAWGSGPLVEHVPDESSRGGGTAVATGGAPPDRAGVSGGKAGPGSTPRAPGPAEPTGCAS
jgi:hypothetical protein